MKPWLLLVLAGMAAVAAAGAQSASPQPAPGAQDLTGVWLVRADQIGFFSKQKPALTRAGQKLYRARQTGKSQDPTRTCTPIGFPRNMYTRFPLQIVQDGQHILELFPTSQRVRRIYIDGRPQDQEMLEDFGPLYNGYAVGKWDGKAWVVQTVGLTPIAWIDAAGAPKSAEAKVTERIRRNGDTLVIDTTIEDPVMLARPWTAHKVYDRGTEDMILDRTCRSEIAKNPKWASQGR